MESFLQRHVNVGFLACCYFASQRKFRDGVFWNEDGTWSFSPSCNYTWIWSSLTFGVTVMPRAFTGKIMKEGKANRKRVV